MNLYIAFAQPQYMMLPVWLFLGLNCVPSAIAGDTFNSVPSSASSFASIQDKKDLTLKDAAGLALRHNPELAAFDKEMRALEGATLQAGLLRNPEVSVSVDNAGNMGTGRGSGAGISPTIKHNFEQQDLIFRVSQLIELGGKRAAQVHAASLGQELAGKDYETKRLARRPSG